MRRTSLAPDDILVCDVCRTAIGDLRWGMVFWEPPTPGSGEHVKGLKLAHKGRCDDRELTFSFELRWFPRSPFEASHDALHQLAELNHNYNWTREQLTRLIDIAWACSVREKRT